MDHWVYRAYDEVGELLYVGVTRCGMSRLRDHCLLSPWSSHVFSLRIEHFDTRHEALTRERHLIDTLAPTYNVQGQRRDEPEPEGDGLLSPRGVAERLGISVFTVRRRIKEGALRAVSGSPAHPRYRIDPVDVDRWLHSTAVA